MFVDLSKITKIQSKLEIKLIDFFFVLKKERRVWEGYGSFLRIIGPLVKTI
jgi:hypothetical protein